MYWYWRCGATADAYILHGLYDEACPGDARELTPHSADDFVGAESPLQRFQRYKHPAGIRCAPSTGETTTSWTPGSRLTVSRSFKRLLIAWKDVF